MNTVIVMEQQIPVAALQTMNVQLSLNDMQVFVSVYAESDRHFWFEFKKKKKKKKQKQTKKKKNKQKENK